MFTFIEILRKQSHKHSPSTDSLLYHTKAKAKQTIELVKFSQPYLKTQCVWREQSWFEDLRYKDLTNNCLEIVIVYAKCINKGITKKINCYCLFQVVNSGTQNYANYIEFLLKLITNLFLFYLQSISSYFIYFFINYNTITNWFLIIWELSNFDYVLGVVSHTRVSGGNQTH